MSTKITTTITPEAPAFSSVTARIPLGDGSSWPRPVLVSDEPDLMWTLTYGTPTRADERTTP